MKNRWLDREAKRFVRKYGKQGTDRDVALRVYTSRLLGQEPKLVIHGGGNTSVKTKIRDIHGESTNVLCIKGSGWDLGNIEPEGLPAVKIAALQKLVKLNSLSDEGMVNIQRVNLLDANSPNPSVETLLHAFLPHKFIDHTHSNAILALCDQPNGRKICEEVFGDRVVYVPYIMPGFALAKKSLQCFDAAVSKSETEPLGMILLKHGLVSFGSTARESYDRMIHLVNIAERSIKESRKRVLAQRTIPKKIEKLEIVAPTVRGLLNNNNNSVLGNRKLVVLNFRNGKKIQNYVNGTQLKRYSQQGTVTPDHVIRIKPKPLLLEPPIASEMKSWRRSSEKIIKEYIREYTRYFVRNNKLFGNKKKQLDPMPRVILIPGFGLFGVGSDAATAKISADLAEVNIEVITNAEETGRFKCISEKEIFEIEHWSLEQAKLGKTKEKPLQRKIVAITGGASGIGAATAEAFHKEGAEVVILDVDVTRAQDLSKKFGLTYFQCDVTKDRSVLTAFEKICRKFGGVDIVVSNAGAAWQGEIGRVDPKLLRESFELNFWAHQRVAQAGIKIMQMQNTGGCLLFNTSKQAINPGKKFGPYGLPKATTLFLMKQYALDHGVEKIRSNAVNADRIRTGLLTDQMISSRAKSRGISESNYMSGNLLAEEVSSKDVAAAFVHLAKASKTTAAVLTVDGGNIEASLR